MPSNRPGRIDSLIAFAVIILKLATNLFLVISIKEHNYD
jgi:hypothetical protein